MFLIRLRLENFRQHRETVIDFEPGMTAIVGANGTGKTTILEGITYALYGEQRNKRETIAFYWDDKRKYGATLDFELDKQRYTIERTNNDAVLSLHTADGSTVIASGLTSTKIACEKLLGLTYDQFINSFCAEQKNLAFLNFKNSAARQEEVARMLGFDRLKEAETMARDRKAQCNRVAESLVRTLGNLADLESAKKKASSDLKEIEKQIALLEKQEKTLAQKVGPAAELNAKAEKFRTFSNEMSKLGGEASGLKNAVKLATERLDEAKKQFDRWKELEPKEKEYRRLEAENKEWNRRKDEDRKREIVDAQAKALRCEILEIDDQLRELKLPDLAALERDFVGATERLTRTESQCQELHAKWIHDKSSANEMFAGAKARFEEAQRTFDHREAMVAKGVCPECGQPLAEKFSPLLAAAKKDLEVRQSAATKAEKAAEKLASKPAALDKAEKELAGAKKDLESARKARDAAALAHEQVRVIQKHRTQKAEQAAKLEATLTNSPAIYSAEKHAAIAKQMEALDPEHVLFIQCSGAEKTIANREKDHKKAVADLQTAEFRYKSLKKDRDDLGFASAAKADEAIDNYRSIDRELRDTQSSLRNKIDMKSFAQAAVDQSQQRIVEHQARAKELADTKQSAIEHDVLARELRNLRERLNHSIRPDLAFRASENLNLLTNGRYTTLELRDDFTPLVIEEGVAKPVISGGEEDVVALALRLALSELIQERNGRPMSLLILDEVFGSLDAERRQSVLDKLASLKGRFTQIFVISHVEEINQVADQALYLIRDTETRGTMVTDAPPDAAALLL